MKSATKKFLILFFLFFLSFNSWAQGYENNTPELNPIENKTVNEGEFLTFTVTATDEDGDELRYSANGLPDGAEFDNETQVFTWNPGFEQSGSSFVEFSVSDGLGSDQVLVEINVMDVSPLEAPDGFSVKKRTADFIHITWNPVIQNELAGYNIYRSTADPGNYEKINTGLITGSEFMDYNIDPEANYHYFVTAVDIFDQIEIFTSGLIWPVPLSVNSQGQLFVANWGTGDILSLNAFGEPVIYASGTEYVSNIAFNDGTMYFLEYKDNSTIKTVSSDGEIRPYGPSLKLEYPTALAFNGAGNLYVAEDFSGNIYRTSTNGETWELFYEGLDGPGRMLFDQADRLFVSEDIVIDNIHDGAINTIDSSGTLTVFSSIKDPDGLCRDLSGNLYVAQTELRQISQVMPDGSTRPMIQGVSIWDCVFNNNNEMFATLPWNGMVLKVHTTHESEMSDKLTVLAASTVVNSAPELTPIGNKTVGVNELLEFTVSAVDPDGNRLTYSAENLPTFLSCGQEAKGAEFDPETRIFSWTPEAGQDGIYNNVTFTVTDDGIPPASDSEVISITVIK